MIQKANNLRPLGIFSLAMITAVSVDSVRNLPATALFGSSLIFFFLLGAIFFLLPCALVSAELASNSTESGGIYAWVKNAFGAQLGVFAIWMQWIENVIWYPAILSFVAGTIGFLISPNLANSKVFLISVILVAFWGATVINLFGIKSSARFSNFCAVTGLLLPMTLIMALGATWIISGNPLQIHFATHDLLPNLGQSQVWVALTGIMLSFCGMEIATVHDRDVSNPQRSYPRAMLLATLLIVVTLVCGALAIAIVLPEKQISLVAGIMQAFQAFFAVYHLTWLLPFIAVTLVIGGMGSVSNWIIAPTRGLLLAAKDGYLPRHFGNQNKFGMPQSTFVLSSCYRHYYFYGVFVIAYYQCFLLVINRISRSTLYVNVYFHVCRCDSLEKCRHFRASPARVSNSWRSNRNMGSWYCWNYWLSGYFYSRFCSP